MLRVSCWFESVLHTDPAIASGFMARQGLVAAGALISEKSHCSSGVMRFMISRASRENASMYVRTRRAGAVERGKYGAEKRILSALRGEGRL